MPATERLLLHSLLASDVARAQVIPELSGLSAVDRFVSRNVFQALFAMHSDGGPFRFSDLEGRLSEADRDLLSSAVFADEVLEEEKAAEQAMACLRSLKSQDPRVRSGSSPRPDQGSRTPGRSSGGHAADSGTAFNWSRNHVARVPLPGEQ